MEACYLTLRRLSTDMEEAGFCGRGMMGVVASLGRGGGGGGGGGWYQVGWRRGETNQIRPPGCGFLGFRVALWDCTSIILNVLLVSKETALTLFGHLTMGFPE